MKAWILVLVSSHDYFPLCWFWGQLPSATFLNLSPLWQLAQFSLACDRNVHCFPSTSTAQTGLKDIGPLHSGWHIPVMSSRWLNAEKSFHWVHIDGVGLGLCNCRARYVHAVFSHLLLVSQFFSTACARLRLFFGQKNEDKVSNDTQKNLTSQKMTFISTPDPAVTTKTLQVTSGQWADNRVRNSRYDTIWL